MSTAADPYVPVQAQYRSDPWRVLVCCMMLNLTSRVQVIPIIDELFERFPSPVAMRDADESLEALIAPCGLSRQRANRLRRMAEEFIGCEVLSPYIVENLHGCGRYAADSFAIFCQGYYDIKPADKVLREYLEWKTEI